MNNSETKTTNVVRSILLFTLCVAIAAALWFYQGSIQGEADRIVPDPFTARAQADAQAADRYFASAQAVKAEKERAAQLQEEAARLQKELELEKAARQAQTEFLQAQLACETEARTKAEGNVQNLKDELKRVDENSLGSKLAKLAFWKD